MISVLWVSVLLALLAGQVTRLSRGDLNLAYNLHQGTRAELAANGALWTAVYVILNEAPDAWRIDGTVYAWRLGGAEVRVRVTDELGRIDVNAAHPLLLSSLFTAAGTDPEVASAFAEEIAIYRYGQTEATALRRAAKLPEGGKSFATVEQLYDVPGASAELLDRVVPALTVHTGRPWPEAGSASPLVLAATEQRVLAEDAADSAGDQLPPPAEDLQSLEAIPTVLAGAERPEEPIDSDTLRIEAEALTADGVHFARKAIFFPFASRDRPWEFRLWHRGDRLLFPTTAQPGR